MGYHPEILGFLILACSVNMIPMPENGILSSNNTKPRHERSPPGGWSSSNSKNLRRATMSDGSDPFVFPDQTGTVQKFIPKKIHECANGTTFCENVDGYPSKYLENVLQDSGVEFMAMFGNDLVNDLSLFHKIDSLDETPLCPSVEQLVHPQTAKNKDNQWLFVVNQGQYRQGVRIEKCLAPDNPPQRCAFTEGFPIGYKTFCKQKYIYRRLLALNEGGKAVADTFKLPSCCACTVQTEGLTSRVGNPGQRKLTGGHNSSSSAK